MPGGGQAARWALDALGQPRYLAKAGDPKKINTDCTYNMNFASKYMGNPGEKRLLRAIYIFFDRMSIHMVYCFK
jgi:hypothetical protein